MPGRSGWKDWELFAPAVRHVLDRISLELNYTPRGYELRARRHQWILSAAYRYHGGYLAVLDRLGWPRPPRRHRPRRPPPPTDWNRQQANGFVPRGFWHQRSHQLHVLRQGYADDLAWGVMPASTRVAKRHAGLAVHWLRSPGGWPAAAAAFNLMTPTDGRRQRIRYAIINEALSFYEHHWRWPHPRECSHSLRFRRWQRGGSWTSVLEGIHFHPRIIERLQSRWKLHYAWAGQHQDQTQVQQATRVINQLIIELYRREPFGRSSP